MLLLRGHAVSFVHHAVKSDSKSQERWGHYAGQFADPVVPPPACTRRTTSLLFENHEFASSVHVLVRVASISRFNNAWGMMECKQRAQRKEFDGHYCLQLAAMLARMRDISSRSKT